MRWGEGVPSWGKSWLREWGGEFLFLRASCVESLALTCHTYLECQPRGILGFPLVWSFIH